LHYSETKFLYFRLYSILIPGPSYPTGPRAPKPEGPKQPMRYFFLSRGIIVTAIFQINSRRVTHHISFRLHCRQTSPKKRHAMLCFIWLCVHCHCQGSRQVPCSGKIDSV